MVASGPLPGSSVASSTVPWALRSGLAFRSSSSACSRIWSSSSCTLVPALAEIGVASVVPPNSSSTTPCASRSCLTFCTLAVGRSILLIATTIGTPAFLACEIFLAHGLEAERGRDQLDHIAVEPLVDRQHLPQLLEGERDDLLGGDLEVVGELGDGDELRHPHQRLLALLLVTSLLLLDVAEAGTFLAAVYALAPHRSFDRGEGTRDVLRHGLLVDQRLLPLLALLPLVAPPLFERARAGGRGGHRPGRDGAAGRRAGHRLGAHGRGDHGARGGGGRRGQPGAGTRGGRRCRERARGERLGMRLPGRGQLLEQRGGALFERGFLLVVDRLGGLERLARLELALGLDGGFGLRLRVRGGDFGRGAAAALGTLLRGRGHRLGGGLDGAPSLGRRRRLFQLALLALPARAHERHLLRLERGEMAAHEDVLLLEHADELLCGDAELSRQIVNPRRRHSLLQRPDQAARQRGVGHPDRLDRRPAEPVAQCERPGPPHDRHPAGPREALHFFQRARAGVARQHDAAQRVALQLRPHARHADHHSPAPAREPQPQQPDDPRVHAAGAGVSPGAPAGPGSGSSSPPSSVISFRKAMSLSASSGVMPAILSTSSRSRSRMSCSVLWPACASTSTSSAGSPLSSRSATLVAASSSGRGSGANSGPSPPRSSHSRLEYRSIFQPVSSEARRTFWPLRPIASESWSSSTIAWIVLVSGSENTRATRAGASASLAKRSGSGDHGTMSMRSPFNSFTTACTREPFIPTHAPTGSIESSRDETAILVRLPASRAVARISTICCWISGTSSLNRALTKSGSARDRLGRGPFGVSSIRFSTARIVSPW